MLKRLNGIFEKARHVEATLAASVEGAATRVTGASYMRTPLETIQAVVDAVARDIQPAGRGRNGFPFQLIRVTLLAPTARAKAQLQGVLEGPEPLASRIEARLRAAGCSVPGLSVRVGFVAKVRSDWTHPDFHVDCVRVSDGDAAATTSDPRLDLVVVEGRASRTTYSFGATAVALGRGTDVTDSRGRLVRMNQVAFTSGDGDEVNQTVSRLHAHIEYDAASGQYRLFDDGSAQGTSVIRAGRGHVVSRGTLGLVLVSGDELVLGRARMKVKIVR